MESGARGQVRREASSVSSLAFARTAERLAEAAAGAGLAVPTFRSPPRVAGVHRTVRRRPDGGAVVAVARRGRRLPAVVADLIEGVVVANGLEPAEAARARAALWDAVADDVEQSIAAA